MFWWRHEERGNRYGRVGAGQIGGSEFQADQQQKQGRRKQAYAMATPVHERNPETRIVSGCFCLRFLCDLAKIRGRATAKAK